ncbi:hypothetical protein D3C80_1780540 [compost metagenome]
MYTLIKSSCVKVIPHLLQNEQTEFLLLLFGVDLAQEFGIRLVRGSTDRLYQRHQAAAQAAEDFVHFGDSQIRLVHIKQRIIAGILDTPVINKFLFEGNNLA